MHPLYVAAALWLVWLAGWTIAARFVKTTKSTESALLRLQHIVPAGVGFLLMFHGGDWYVVSGKLYDIRAVQWTGVVLTAGAGANVRAMLEIGGVEEQVIVSSA